jgi:cyclopropane fatty-acyl-phospholipid synthase-like methyltransferase
MDSAKITTFDSAASTLKGSIDGLSVDQAQLDKSNAAVLAAQNDAAAKTQTVDADAATLQSQFDALVAAALDLGLKVNIPPAAAV